MPARKPAAAKATATKSPARSPATAKGKPVAAKSAATKPGPAAPKAKPAAAATKLRASPPKATGKRAALKAKFSPSTTAERHAAFAELRELLVRHANRLKLISDRVGEIYFDAGFSPEWKKILFFGAAAVRKSYVSYYLFPVYVFPELLQGMSPALKARMQGKSCFNFQRTEPALFAELDVLTQRAIERFGKAGWLR